ncbi:tripartite motif-containing protein 75-like [Neoarius graeffei]|uniref:tripartite motif-containing protein 75-like n=1 Tax=Neoarius graeffei TaxID=443677 RepID=UPI00298BC94B|nr:tripartite motif-containing protein 75-like [Neoarius graeffei]
MHFPFRKRSSVPRSRGNSNVSCCPVVAGSAVLYCETCDQPLSSRCVINGTHRDHRLKDLKDAVHDQVEKVEKLSKDLTEKEKKFGNFIPKIDAAERKLEEMCKQTEELLQKEYSALMALIEHNQQQAFFILNAQKETIKRQLHQLLEDTHNYKAKSTAIIEDIKQLSSKEESENPASLLGEISALETSLYTMKEFYSSVDKKLEVDDTKLKALENSIKKIVERNKELLPRPWEFSETINLDESKKPENVQISEDKTEMSVNPSSNIGLSSQSPWNSMQASQTFDKGLHYWEVAVGDCESWAVGVVEQSRAKRIQIQAKDEKTNSWILECDGGELSVLHNNDFSRVKESNIQTLGVFLDCDKGRLKFYNVNTGFILHSFFVQFKGSMCPVFRIRAETEKMAHLKICNLIHIDEHYDNSDISMPSEMSSEENMESASDISD